MPGRKEPISDDFTMTLDRYGRAVNQADAFADRLEDTTCITAAAFPELEKEANGILAALTKTEAAVGKSYRSVVLNLKPDPVLSKQSIFWDHDEDRDDDIRDGIALQLYRLKHNPCSPDQVFSHAAAPTPVPKQTAYLGGGHFGIELTKNSGRVRSTETPVGSDDPSFQAIDSGDPLGVGIVAGYNLRPWNNSIVVGPFGSFDYLKQTINHNFAGGQFLGTTTNWFANLGVKAGAVTAPGIYVYGLAGVAWLNHDLNVNFATAASSNVTTPGFTSGIGAEYQPQTWQLSGHPVSLFAQYQHTWWDKANFTRPASSPSFNYAFRREDDTVKLGVNFYFGANPAPQASPAYPVKAPVLK
jgi:hypothetical protein